jgi:hypothetical protein
MLRSLKNRTITTAAFLVFFLLILLVQATRQPMMPSPQLLSDPFLQLPTTNWVRVVWFTEFAGSDHRVAYGENLKFSAKATTTKLTRTREDRNSHVGESQKGEYTPIMRQIWRHEAQVTGLTPNTRVPYRVTSVREDGKSVSSGEFTLAPQPTPGESIKILLTSDHQLKPMVAANLQQVVKTVGKVDAVFMAGDLVNIGDRASEWFDDNRGGAFFPCLQGRANYQLAKTIYKGGEIIQHAPLFTAIGNHEVMGRFSRGSLGDEFDDAFPRHPGQNQQDNSFNTDTYEEIFTLPESSSGGKTYYATTFGDVRLVVLYATNMWRSPKLEKQIRGKYQERQQDLNQPDNWGYGQVIFGAISKGTPQYNWLAQELQGTEFRRAKYKIVMLHHPPHSLGDNIVPAYTDPVQIIDRKTDNSIKAVRYEYPKDADYIIRDVMPLLEAAGVQLVFYGHSHLWNRFVSPSGMHFLETSNVGNSYGAAATGGKKREVPSGNDNYVAMGDPNGLEPIIPTYAPLLSKDGQPLPYIASNDITVFSIFDTSTGTVSSYRFDTREPGSEVVKFDEFKLK